MLGQRRRRWASIKLELVESLVFAAAWDHSSLFHFLEKVAPQIRII